MGDIVPRKTLVSQGSKAIGGIGGGIVLLALNGIGGVPALIVGGIIALIGAGISSSKEDRITGFIVIGAGVLTALGVIPFLKGISNILLSISGIGLLVTGGLNLFRFLRGMRNRR